MSDVPHIGFIVAAYGAAALALGCTVVVLLVDYLGQKRQLARLGETGRDRT